MCQESVTVWPIILIYVHRFKPRIDCFFGFNAFSDELYILFLLATCTHFMEYCLICRQHAVNIFKVKKDVLHSLQGEKKSFFGSEVWENIVAGSKQKTFG